MLNLHKVKGTLEADADADLLVLEASEETEGKRTLKVAQVWKFGTLVHDASNEKFGL